MKDIVTLTTDFGLNDSYVSEMKGVLLDLRPQAEIIDITHSIPSFDKDAAKFQLWRSYRWFPKQTCHLAIVDPGVGGDRKNLFIQTELGNFLGPDNGILDWAVLDAEKRSQKAALVYEIPVPEGVPPTFYGRDVFIPFLGHFLSGNAMRLNRIESFKLKGFPENKKSKNSIRSQVIYVDKFGNGVLAVSPYEISKPEMILKKKKLGVFSHYQAIPKGKVGLIPGSHGLWEIAAYSNSAAKLLGFKKGDEVLLQVL
ncbi:MAG: S-adenosyl-l-methionine hydroxide adenosyltransferase family protein [Pseudomonadota bacterium]